MRQGPRATHALKISPEGAPFVTRVVCGGLVALDLVLDVAAHPTAGDKHRAPASRLSVGGGACNAAVAIARLGGHAMLVGTVGDDAFGEILRARIRDIGIDDSLLRTSTKTRTSHSAITITPDGERTIVNFRVDAEMDSAALLPDRLAFEAALADTRFPIMAEALMGAARRRRVPGVMDAEAPVAPALKALRAASHVAFSSQGLQDFCGGADGRALEEASARLGRWVGVTRGADPVSCHDGTSMIDVPVPDVTPIDTLGAGDTWHAAFALALAEGATETEAIQSANETAAQKVCRLPPWDEPT